MQWFIDVIMAMVADLLAAFKVTIHGQLGYFNRGDPATNDFAVGDFTQDGAFHVLDLSGIVPAGARAVAFRCQVRSAAANKILTFLSNGQFNIVNAGVCRTVVANMRHEFALTVNVDSDRKAKYHASVAGFNIINCTVTGWWLR